MLPRCPPAMIWTANGALPLPRHGAAQAAVRLHPKQGWPRRRRQRDLAQTTPCVPDAALLCSARRVESICSMPRTGSDPAAVTMRGFLARGMVLVLPGRRLAILIAGLITCAWSSTAAADPCEGTLPSSGARVSDVVRYVGDGDSLCIGPPAKPDQWIEIRLGDFYAPELHASGGAEAKRRLARLALGKMIVCRAGRRSYDRVIGYCTLAGKPLGRQLRDAGGTQGGKGWRQSRR